MCCSVLQCVALYRNSSPEGAECCSAWRVQRLCSVLEGTQCCRVFECVAECCRLLQSVAGCCRVMQSVAECCSVLQSVAECCRVGFPESEPGATLVCLIRLIH